MTATDHATAIPPVAASTAGRVLPIEARWLLTGLAFPPAGYLASLITSVDGRVHREQFERTAKFRRPTFIDKPLTVSVEDAEAIMRTARAQKIPLMSCSSVRYSDNVVEASLNAWAAKTLPTVKGHLDKAKAIDDKLDSRNTTARNR